MAFPISWTDLTPDSSPRTQPLESRGGDVYFIVHHAFNQRVQDTIALSKPGGREVSMTFAVGPTVAGAASPIYCVYVVPLDRRPWTTASFIDDQALTAEVSNLDLAAPYPVALEAKETLAQIAAEMHRAYGMPLDRQHILDHSEVYGRGWGSYATACCGPDLRGSLDWIVERAKQIVAGVPGRDGDDDMPRIYERGVNSGVFAIAPTAQGFTRFNADDMPNQRGVMAQAFGPIITMHASDFDELEKKFKPLLTLPASQGGGSGSGASEEAVKTIVKASEERVIAKIPTKLTGSLT